MMGKGRQAKGTGHVDVENHQSAPLSTLRDPASFAPPPKNRNYYGEGASSPGGTVPSSPGGAAPPAPKRITGGWGGALSAEELQAQQDEKDAEIRAQEAEALRGPPVPYRANTTGLSTSHLPPPPMSITRREQDESQALVLQSNSPAPRLPPRLPPRQNSNPDEHAPLPPPTYQAATKPTARPPPQLPTPQLNQQALGRLGNAGVSVPGFNIGAKSPPPIAPRPDNTPIQMEDNTSKPAGNNPQLSELQSRFSRMKTSPTTDPPAEGTTWAQKQAALRSASDFQKDPSSVSLSDAKSAATTANNFRERHGEEAKQSYQAANGLNKKYGLVDKAGGLGQKYGLGERAGSFAGRQTASPPAATSPTTSQAPAQPLMAELSGVAAKKKPPPPPPKKKFGAATDTTNAGGPPPLPLASKPKPNIGNSVRLPGDEEVSTIFRHIPITNRR
jgi:hypothetical protein